MTSFRPGSPLAWKLAWSKVRLVRAGLIDLAQFDLTEFGLDDINDAVAHAAASAGPLRLTVLRPDRGGASADPRAVRLTNLSFCLV
jgi:hypothetical protein